MTRPRTRTAILISGRGSNMMALVEAARRPDYPAEIVGVVSNRPDAADQISAIVDDVAISLAPRRGDLELEVARAYATIFTEDELKKISEFYQSEAGKKLIEQTPVVARAIDQAARLWTNGIQRDLQQAIAKKLDEAGLR